MEVRSEVRDENEHRQWAHLWVHCIRQKINYRLVITNYIFNYFIIITFRILLMNSSFQNFIINSLSVNSHRAGDGIRYPVPH